MKIFKWADSLHQLELADSDDIEGDLRRNILFNSIYRYFSV